MEVTLFDEITIVELLKRIDEYIYTPQSLKDRVRWFTLSRKLLKLYTTDGYSISYPVVLCYIDIFGVNRIRYTIKIGDGKIVEMCQDVKVISDFRDN